jgi:peptidyl-prolyl cis-trans isomerase SDCCAG10
MRKRICSSSSVSIQEQIKKLQGEIKQIGAPKKQVEKPTKQTKSSVEMIREQYLNSGKAVRALGNHARGDVEQRLNRFTHQLKEVEVKSSKEAKKKSSKANEVSDWECSLHFIKNCSSCRDTFGETISEDDEDWMAASLHFPKEIGANVFEPKIDDYTVVDPRQGYLILI